VIYLDNAATTYPKPPSVIEAVVRCFQEAANPGRGGHRLALAASRIIFETRAKVADFLGAEDESDVIFTLNATEAINLALKGTLRPGDHVITTSMEHNAVTRPLRSLQKKGVEVTKVACAADGGLKMEELRQAIKPQTKMIAATLASNVSGTVMPIEEISSLAKERGLLLLVDAAQGAGVLPVDVKRQAIDLLAFAGHKGMLGPQGTGGLYMRPGLEVEEAKQGGTGSQSESDEQPVIRPDRYESGTLNTPGLAGLGAAVSFINEVSLAEIRQKEKTLTTLLVEELKNMKGVTIYGPPLEVERVPVVSINIEGVGPEEVSFILDGAYDIATRSGLHCAPDAHRTIGTFDRGTVRLSLSYFNTREEVAKAVDAINAIVKEKAKGKKR
jgi:cysteine desulfurase family protein